MQIEFVAAGAAVGEHRQAGVAVHPTHGGHDVVTDVGDALVLPGFVDMQRPLFPPPGIAGQRRMIASAGLGMKRAGGRGKNYPARGSHPASAPVPEHRYRRW